MSDLTYNNMTTVLKVRIGNGQSAVDVEWDDDRLCWFVSARGWGSAWFSVSPDDGNGYAYAVDQAGELEARIQRMHCLRDEAKAAEEELREFVESRKRAGDKQCA